MCQPKQIEPDKILLPKQLSCLEVTFARYVMKVPGSATDEIPRGHVAGVPCRGKDRFRFQQLRLDSARNALRNLILNSEKSRVVAQFCVVAEGEGLASNIL